MGKAVLMEDIAGTKALWQGRTQYVGQQKGGIGCSWVSKGANWGVRWMEGQGCEVLVSLGMTPVSSHFRRS